jgi:hypothetical protein
MTTELTYAASEIQRQLERGPYEGEDFFRLKVSGDGQTKTVNITPAQLAEIVEVLNR